VVTVTYRSVTVAALLLSPERKRVGLV
jgi:hypothetical protein